jgi:hypothetical protein
VVIALVSAHIAFLLARSIETAFAWCTGLRTGGRGVARQEAALKAKATAAP